MEACPGKLEYLETATCLTKPKIHKKKGCAGDAGSSFPALD